MPSVGVSPASVRPNSHTSTNEWQSFEIRMRKRRAQRCVLRAEVALEAGFEEDARAALEEARRLDSFSPDFETVRKSVEERRAADAAARQQDQVRRSALYAAAAIVTLVLGSAPLLFGVRQGPSGSVGSEVRQGPSAADAAVASLAAAVSPAPEPVVSKLAPPASPADAVGSAGRTEPVARADAKADAKKSAIDEAAARKAAAAERDRLAAEALRAKNKPLPPVAPQRTIDAAMLAQTNNPPRTEVAAAAPITSPADLPASAVNELPGTPAPAAKEPPAVAPAPELDERGVRAALARYESAYTNLNASAVQSVWPGVDERSLTRAFDNLDSQRVSLGRCSISINGSAATAACNGSATWTPKVGGGTRTEPRRWQFQLANNDGSWQIVATDAR